MAKRLCELIRQTCSSLDVYIISGHVADDHVHLFVSVPPGLSVSELMKRVKGRSSRRMLEESDELSRQFWGRHLRAPGFFAASSGNVTAEVIQQYIEAQGQAPDTDDDNFKNGDNL